MQNWFALANNHVVNGRFEDALQTIDRLIDQQPNNSMAHCVRGIALDSLRRQVEALNSYRTALSLDPSNIIAANHLGILLNHLGQPADAMKVLECALSDNYSPITTQHAALWTTLAMIQLNCQLIAAAESSSREALKLNPKLVSAHNNLAQALKGRNLYAESLAHQQIAVNLSPGDASRHSALLFDMNYLADLDVEILAHKHRRFGVLYGASDPVAMKYSNLQDPNRRLRIGYLSPDFRAHSVAFFIEPLLVAHNRTNVEVTCYANIQKPDPMTHHLRESSDRWRNVWSLVDNELSGLIRNDGIDILVDLAGHTANNRLRVFGMKPAPIQVTWLGYPNTTGLHEIDYRLTDEWADPSGLSDKLHTEKLIRLPHGFLCYRSLCDCPVSEPPVSTNGYITFGCFNSSAKVNNGVLDTWCKLLTDVPNSRLLLKSKQMDSKTWLQSFLESFKCRGIHPARIEYRGHTSTLNEHLATYSHVDIALDTFPYNGTTTTCEALWMGVPVVALAGDRHAGRVGVSLLHRIGLDELIASTRDNYWQLAAALARDTDRLAKYRSTLRILMRKSPLTDAEEFARDIETTYRSMWRTWCVEHKTSG